MARTRLLKPGFFKNPVLARLSERHRLLFAGLWTIADRGGRLKDDPEWIRAELFPYQRGVKVDALLTDLDRAGFIQRYEVTEWNSKKSTGETRKSEGEAERQPIKAIAITKFSLHQHPHIHEQNSEIPPPPAPTKVGAEHYTSPSYTVSNTVPKDKSSPAIAGRLPASTVEAQQNLGVITKIAHEVIDLLGPASADLPDTVKGLCAHRHIAYDSAIVHQAIDSARAQRARQASL